MLQPRHLLYYLCRLLFRVCDNSVIFVIRIKPEDDAFARSAPCWRLPKTHQVGRFSDADAFLHMRTQVDKKVGKRERYDSLNTMHPLPIPAVHSWKRAAHHAPRKVPRLCIWEIRQKCSRMLVIGKKVKRALRLRVIPLGMDCDRQSDMREFQRAVWHGCPPYAHGYAVRYCMEDILMENHVKFLQIFI